MKLFFKKFATTLKKYWHMFLLVTLVVAFFIFNRKKNIDFSQRLEEIQATHQAELAKIEKIRQQERLEHEENEKKLRQTLELLQAKYDEQMRVFDNKLKAEVEKLVKLYKNDPVALAEEVSKTTGFKIIYPEE
jgi:hypothetical protein